MRYVTLAISVFLILLAGYFYLGSQFSLPVDARLAQISHIAYYLDTTKFRFEYNPGTKQLNIKNAKGEGTQFGLNQERYSEMLSSWTKIYAEGVTEVYIPNSQTCKYLVINVSYTNTSERTLTCEAKLITKQDLVPI